MSRLWLFAQSVEVGAPKVNLDSAVGKVTNFLVFLAGALSVIFILYGAFQYVISGGNPDATKRAKDTILYALIGVLVSAIAYAAVNFIFTELGS